MTTPAEIAAKFKAVADAARTVELTMKKIKGRQRKSVEHYDRPRERMTYKPFAGNEALEKLKSEL